MKVLMIEPKDLGVLSTERLQEIKTRYNAISSSPWIWYVGQNAQGQPTVEIMSAMPGFVGSGKKVAILEGDEAYRNAEFITKAQEDLFYLMTALESLINLLNSAMPKGEEGTEAKVS